MKLYLSRHGEASHSGPDKPSALTPKGISDVTRMGEYLARKMNVKIAALWHSPKIRAVQTAEIYRKQFGPGPVLEEKKEVEPDGDSTLVYRQVLDWKGGDIMIVSHLPVLPNLSMLLLSGSPFPGDLTFPTAGVAAFELMETARYLWSLHPSLLP